MAGIGPELPPHLRKNSSDVEEESKIVAVGPQIPPEILNRPPNQEESDESDDDYGPALPPDLLASRTGTYSSNAAPGPSKKIVGPSLQPSYPTTYDRNAQYGDDDSDDDFGPKPLPAGVTHKEPDAVQLFMEKEEKRRKEVEVSGIPLSCLDAPTYSCFTQEAAKPKAPKRDEWILVPPTSSDLLGGAC